MEPDIIAKDNGLTVIHRGGRTIVIHDAQGNPGHIPAVVFDKVVFEELQAMCRMAVHMVADMSGDRAYTVAAFLSSLFGGYVKDINVQLGETETR